MASKTVLTNLIGIDYNMPMLIYKDIYPFKRNWYAFWDMLNAFNRHSELQRLVRWANEHALTGPEKLYRSRLHDEELRLNSYRMRTPRLVIGARLLFLFGCLISPTPRYHSKGSAAQYRYNNRRYLSKN